VTGPSVVAVGGGHGLAVTLRACVGWAGRLTAVVSVADDGGSSGRIRSSTGLPAPGDLRRCLTALADPSRAVLAAALERRFEGGDLDGHPAGNVLLAALTAECGDDLGRAAEHAAAILGVPDHVAVLPASTAAVELVATTVDGERIEGQVAIEAAGRVDRLAVEPSSAEPPRAAVDAVDRADVVVLGPGSLYGSVLAAATVPVLRDAIAAARGTTVFVCNLRPRPPETAGYDVAAHVAALRRHGITPDAVVVQRGSLPVGDAVGADVVEADVARPNGLAHDPARLGEALRAFL
jgi:uncharacterized cofD-like protein